MFEALASIILSIALALGAPVSPSQPVSQPVSVTCEEDMPCWDSSTMGNLKAGTAMEQDAWIAVHDLGLVPASPNQALVYVETLDYLPSSFPVGYFPVGSDSQPQLVHVMQWVTLYHA